MKLDQPIADVAYAPFFIRVPLGVYLILSGRAKLDGMPGFVLPDFVIQMQNMKVLPDYIATTYAILMPYLEIVAGALLLIGFWTTFAAILSSVLFAMSLYLWGIYTTETKMMFNKDAILLGCSISLLYSGGGFLSMDRFRRG